MMHLIDRRLDGRNKSAVNRARFLRRYKEHIRAAVKGLIAERSITDMDKGGEVSVPAKNLAEPSFRHGGGGDWESVHPGNREFVKGDKIRRPDGSGDGAMGGGEPGTGRSEDDFSFALSREEFLNIFFDDLELPYFARNRAGAVAQKKPVRAGYVREGAPCNLCVVRTLKTAWGRRIALGAPARESLELAREELERALQQGADAEQVKAIEQEIAKLEAQIERVPFLDELDLRYRHRISVPQPVARAVMFCLMDVSASMDENKKDLAKRFFTLLYMFLTRKYEHVELVFIRHTDDAEEVDEQTFFHDTRSGGTIVCSALELMHEICTARYPASTWNIYAAQASDGEAFGADVSKSGRFLGEALLPLARYFAYIEIPATSYDRASSLWREYEQTAQNHRNLAMRRVRERREIYPVFRELFSPQESR
ncbi:MAG: YeaH/YhbH family protein [Betaproteobacteria bacterium]|nr:YeaH/YhbH family protein [Betaproteobacteria bacterium]